jgi:sulfatase modifying factor 1
VTGCCAPSRDPVPGNGPLAVDTRSALVTATVQIPAGEVLLGSTHPQAYPEDGEGPVRRVKIDAFGIAPHAVSNLEFERFVEATGYTTDAERFSWSFVFAGLLPDDFPDTRAVVEAPWWRQVEGA